MEKLNVVSKVLGVSKGKIKDMCKSGEITFEVVNGVYYVDEDEVKQKLKKNHFNKKNVIEGIKFIPKHLTDEEVEFCKGIKFDGNNKCYHKDGINAKFGVEMFLPSPKSKEIWAIIYKTKPSKLNNSM